ncbi:unnamed protein product [Vitrella brassicaformis CCMP3155]|uniref:Uncharacterized protein n=1 Tax=Vitrella brassicaformis (strain CCMP3155) TaxID=1169540 RepID=A0A0G4FG27_VITBC|nr:unnamed protein product [Vitrella brassicaformis CCMP3155]|eukprot:CEM12200.1 unnamed protein product [Vitrella brassicaformis CCMP3155]
MAPKYAPVVDAAALREGDSPKMLWSIIGAVLLVFLVANSGLLLLRCQEDVSQLKKSVDALRNMLLRHRMRSLFPPHLHSGDTNNIFTCNISLQVPHTQYLDIFLHMLWPVLHQRRTHSAGSSLKGTGCSLESANVRVKMEHKHNKKQCRKYFTWGLHRPKLQAIQEALLLKRHHLLGGT